MSRLPLYIFFIIINNLKDSKIVQCFQALQVLSLQIFSHEYKTRSPSYYEICRSIDCDWMGSLLWLLPLAR